MEAQIPLQRSPSPADHSHLPGRLDPATDGPRIVAIGGGTGLPAVLQGVRRNLPGCHHQSPLHTPESLTAIVTVTDDGGSSGWVRREYGTLPPGDVRNCLTALADASPLASLLQHRFAGTGGQSLGNLMLAGLAQITGDFAEAIDQMAQMLSTTGRVLPSTRENISLRAEFDSGEVVEGETAIAKKRQAIKRLWLERPVRPLPEALRALVNADGIVVGPGSLYTSVLPNLLVGGIAPTISGVNGVRIYVANLMTEPGETDGFSLDDHLRVIYEHVGMHLFDYVLVNRRPLTGPRAAAQALGGAHPVYSGGPLPHGGGATVVFADLLTELPSGEVRHSPDELGAGIARLVGAGRPAHLAKLL